MQGGVGGGDRGFYFYLAVKAQGLAVPVGHDAAGIFDNGYVGRHVPFVQVGFRDNIDETHGQHGESVAIHAKARHSGGGGQAFKGLGLVGVINVQRSGEQICLGQAIPAAGLDRSAIECSRAVHAPRPAFTADRLVNHADHGLAVVGQGNQDAEQGNAGNEQFGAVDGVQNPVPFAGSRFQGEFLPPDTVVGAFGLDYGAHGQFGVPVRDGHGACIGLSLDVQIGAEMGPDDFTGGIRQPFRQRQVTRGLLHNLPICPAGQGANRDFVADRRSNWPGPTLW